MNLLCITASLPYGNSEVFLKPELQEFLRTGHSVTIVPCVGRGPMGDWEGPNIKVLEKSLLSWRIVQAAVLEAMHSPRRALRALAMLFRSRSLRVLITNLAAYPKGLWLATQIRRGRYEHLHAYWAATPATMALIAAEMVDIPWSVTAHRWDILENNLMELKLNKARFMRFISQDGKEFAGSQHSNAVVLHLGVSLPNVVPAVSESTTELTLLCPATLTPIKGHSHLFAALALLRQRNILPRVILAGDGPLRSSLIRESQRLEIFEQLNFAGFISHVELLDLYRFGKVAAVVLPSLHEGIPVSLMEAMAYGVPVIGTMVGGTPELLHGGAGLLVPPSDAQALADAIELITCRPDLRRHLRIVERERVAEEFDVRTIAPEVLRLMANEAVVSGGEPLAVGPGHGDDDTARFCEP